MGLEDKRWLVMNLGVHIKIIVSQSLTCFPSHSSDRLTDYTPSCIGCCHSDGVATVLLQSCYDVAGIEPSVMVALPSPSLEHSPEVSLSHTTS